MQSVPIKSEANDPRPGLPRIFDLAASDRFADQYREVSEGLSFKLVPQDEERLRLIAGCSPYLARLMLRHPKWTHDTLTQSVRDNVTAACDYAKKSLIVSDDHHERIAEQKKILRHAKDYAALAIANTDLLYGCSVMEAAKYLSIFADSVVQTALAIAWQKACDRGLLHHHEGGTGPFPGLIVFAMGKHGAQELNYSSDIDLVALFARKHLPVREDGMQQKAAVTIVRDMVDLLSDQTGDGYVFRTDLRLRPDPGVSSLAVSFAAAEAYYEAYGQNWERAAWIKARPVAGDINLGKEFLERLRPFIWRKYMDFAAIEDINAVRRKISSVQRQNNDGFSGFDIKLGVGGIREIEFFAQTHQLVSGGKNYHLRSRKTLECLTDLTAHGLVDVAVSNRLKDCYVALRFFEHRLQMLYDEQTHQVPRAQEEQERFAAFCGFDTLGALQSELEQVRQHSIAAQQVDITNLSSAALQKGHDGEEIPILDFSGVDHHQQTLETLADMGFKRGEEMSARIRQWQRGEYRATRSERSRSLLDQFLSPLMKALSSASDPDEAFISFDKFLSQLPTGVQVFSLFANNPHVFDILISILTISPRLSDALSKQHGFIEALIDGGWLINQGEQGLHEGLVEALARPGNQELEDVMNIVRRYVGEARFNAAIDLVTGKTKLEEAGKAFSNIADEAITSLIPAAQTALKKQHGSIDGELCVLGFGRLGAQCMTYSSDIDIVFVYDTPGDAMSDGQRSIDGVTWFTRMVRRLVTGLSAATEEGQLYEVDMQLRPSGGAGPAAVKYSAFENYYNKDAWVWELMALTKVRIINGPKALAARLQSYIDQVLCRERDAHTVAKAVVDMRQRLLKDKPALSLWDRKLILGGLTDVEFIFQYLQLTTAHALGLPPKEIQAMCKFYESHQLLTQPQVDTLIGAYRLNETILQLSRLGNGAIYSPKRDGKALTEAIVRNCGIVEQSDLEQDLARSQQAVCEIFTQVIGKLDTK